MFQGIDLLNDRFAFPWRYQNQRARVEESYSPERIAHSERKFGDFISIPFDFLQPFISIKRIRTISITSVVVQQVKALNRLLYLLTTCSELAAMWPTPCCYKRALKFTPIVWSLCGQDRNQL